MVMMLPVVFYSVIMEVLNGGRTLGKQIVGLRVIKQDGGRVTLVDSLMRWMMLSVDLWITMGLGVLVMCLSSRNQRFGDLAAGTLVVPDVADELLAYRPNVPYTNPKYHPTYPQAADLSMNQSEVIDRTLVSDPFDLQGYASRLSVKVQQVLDIVPYPQHDKPQEFLRTVLNDYRYYCSRPLVESAQG